MPSEGDLPRKVDMDTDPQMSHNKYPRDEQHFSDEMNSTPRLPDEGVGDDSIPELFPAETAFAPIGPDTFSGGNEMSNMPTPPVPNGENRPTSEGAGLYGGYEEARSKNDSDKEQE